MARSTSLLDSSHHHGHGHGQEEKVIYYFEAGRHFKKDDFNYTHYEDWPKSMKHYLDILKKHSKGEENTAQNIFVTKEQKN